MTVYVKDSRDRLRKLTLSLINIFLWRPTRSGPFKVEMTTGILFTCYLYHDDSKFKGRVMSFEYMYFDLNSVKGLLGLSVRVRKVVNLVDKGEYTSLRHVENSV